jgi:hypothetical protein
MSEANNQENHLGLLGWLEIIGIAAIALVGYFVLYFSAKMLFPGYLEYVITAGHVLITVAIIIAIRQMEIPAIKQQQNAILKSVNDRFDTLLQRYTPLMLNTRDLKLNHIYRNREEAKQRIVDAIRLTHSKLLMIGVAFYETWSIDNEKTSIRDIIERAGGHIDARFLLLNPHTTAAVLRAFLESKPQDVESFINSNGAKFRDSTLYIDWKKTVKSFSDDCFLNRVRFYRCDPTVWLVITDNCVFVEPYTFGKPVQPRGDDLRMGGHMPVFEFSADSPVAAILEDHFTRLWAITGAGISDGKDDIEDLRLLLEDQDEAAKRLERDVFAVRRETLDALLKSLKNGSHRHAAKPHKAHPAEPASAAGERQPVSPQEPPQSAG